MRCTDPLGSNHVIFCTAFIPGVVLCSLDNVDYLQQSSSVKTSDIFMIQSQAIECILCKCSQCQADVVTLSLLHVHISCIPSDLAIFGLPPSHRAAETTVLDRVLTTLVVAVGDAQNSVIIPLSLSGIE